MTAKDWDSSTICWSNRPSASGKGTYLGSSSSSANGRTFAINAGAAIKKWYAGSANYGIMLESTSSTVRFLGSSDHANANLRPAIQVDYYSMTDANIPTGFYYIKSRANGKYLDLDYGEAANDKNVSVYTYNGGNNQQWYIENRGGGKYHIKTNVNRYYNLDVKGDRDEDETNIQVFEQFYSGNSQQYRIMKDIQGNIVINPMISNSRVLDIYYRNDSDKYTKNVQISGYHMGTNQQWTFERTNSRFYGSLNSMKSEFNSLLGSGKKSPVHNYTPAQCADILYNNDLIITKYSSMFIGGVPKEWVQAILMRELWCVNTTDDAKDYLVESYFEWEQACDDWRNNPELQLTTPYPTKPIPCYTDSSTGLGQIFTSTAIKAINKAADRGIITSINRRDANNWRDCRDVWTSLRNSKDYNINLVTLVLIYEANNLGYETNYYNYTTSQIQALFSKYNGSSNISDYGRETYAYYQILKKYN